MGRLHSSCKPAAYDDLHALPQVAFTQQALRKYSAERNKTHAKLDFIGRLETFDEDWGKLTQLLTGSYLKPDPHIFLAFDENRTKTYFRSPSTSVHAASDSKSNSPLRKAMETEITRNHLALCLIYLPDFVCFGYTLPLRCEHSLQFEGHFGHILRASELDCPRLNR